MKKLRKVGVNKETIYTCYVTENRKLIGVITVKDLFMADEDDKIADIMETHIISVDTLEDKEIVGHMFRKYDFLRYRLWIRIIDLSVSLHLTTLWTSFKMKIQRTSQKWRLLHRMRNRISEQVFLNTLKSRIVWLLILMIRCNDYTDYNE